MTPAFEQFARSKGWSLLHKGETGEYRALNTQAGWLAWQAREVPQWLPIESAPKDGTSILGYWMGGKHDCAIHATKFWRGSWWEPNEDYRQCEPTHWMPLPAAPQQPASLGGDR